MKTLAVRADRVRAGDVVTGVWSEVRQRWDSEHFHVGGVGAFTYMHNFVTLYGRQHWESRSYRAETLLRVHVGEVIC